MLPVGIDVWAFTPPCEPFSHRNHRRSPELVRKAARTIHRMLEPARVARPRTIIVENVDETDARAEILAALLSMEGYQWLHMPMSARDHGPMERARRYWIGWRLE